MNGKLLVIMVVLAACGLQAEASWISGKLGVMDEFVEKSKLPRDPETLLNALLKHYQDELMGKDLKPKDAELAREIESVIRLERESTNCTMNPSKEKIGRALTRIPGVDRMNVMDNTKVYNYMVAYYAKRLNDVCLEKYNREIGEAYEEIGKEKEAITVTIAQDIADSAVGYEEFIRQPGSGSSEAIQFKLRFVLRKNGAYKLGEKIVSDFRRLAGDDSLVKRLRVRNYAERDLVDFTNKYIGGLCHILVRFHSAISKSYLDYAAFFEPPPTKETIALNKKIALLRVCENLSINPEKYITGRDAVRSAIKSYLDGKEHR